MFRWVLGVHAHRERLIWRFAAPPVNTLRTDSQPETNGMPLRVDSILLEHGMPSTFLTTLR